MIPANNDPTMLLAAATGRQPQPRIANAPKAAAMRNMVTGTTATTGVQPPTVPGTPGVGPSMPSTYNEFYNASGLSFPLTATQGLSPKGKYGGFTTQEQLNQAVYGEALGQRAGALGYAADVRSLASRRLMDINKALTEAKTRYADTTTTVPEGMSSTRVDEALAFEPTEMSAKYSPEQLASYRAAMQDYAQKASMVPQSQLEMAADITDTPLYQYARAIATGRYGMNPYQAIGEYGPELDVRSFEQQRELRSLLEENMPYDAARQAVEDEYKSQERAYQEQQRAGAAFDEQVAGLIEQATGLSQNRLRQLTGMSNDMIYASIVNEKGIPGQTPDQKVRNFRELAAGKIADFVKGDETQKMQIIEDLNTLMSEPSQTALAQIQWAMLRQYMTQQGGGQKAVSESLLNQLSPIIDTSSYQTP